MIPIMVPPEVITDMTIQATPPTKPIIVAISIKNSSSPPYSSFLKAPIWRRYAMILVIMSSGESFTTTRFPESIHRVTSGLHSMDSI